MNHLAHFYLSQNKVELLIGNFIADQVKGKQFLQYPESIQKGIQMHRDIDNFTDHHPMVSQSKQRLYPSYHKYAAVIVDVFYDHILAVNWESYSKTSLNSFSQSCYAIFHAHSKFLPPSSKKILHFMSNQNWLFNYANIDGIERTLISLSKRAKFDSKMEQSIQDLKADFDFHQSTFLVFFPELIEFVNSNKFSNPPS